MPPTQGADQRQALEYFTENRLNTRPLRTPSFAPSSPTSGAAGADSQPERFAIIHRRHSHALPAPTAALIVLSWKAAIAPRRRILCRATNFAGIYWRRLPGNSRFGKARNGLFCGGVFVWLTTAPPASGPTAPSRTSTSCCLPSSSRPATPASSHSTPSSSRRRTGR
jgi:hypothetical protein